MRFGGLRAESSMFFGFDVINIHFIILSAFYVYQSDAPTVITWVYFDA